MAIQAEARPNTTTKYSKNLNGYVRAKIVNEMTRALACYVAIDGYKIKFRLAPRRASKWYSATDTAYKYTDFSTWCDYIELHPSYLEYKMY